MAKRRGGQYKHWAEEARVWAWYYEIKRRCDWTDYKLNIEFALTENGKASYSSAERPRIFEWIRKVARKPAGRDERWRNMQQLIVAVEQHPLFKGTQALYEAKLWTFLQERSITPELLQSRLEQSLKANDLVRVPFEKLSPQPGALISKFGFATLFDRCLRLSLGTMDSLSKIELIWLLYQQTESPHNKEFRDKIIQIADNLLDHFFFDRLPQHHLNFYCDAIEYLQGSRLDITSGYGYLEVEGTWPVVPKFLAGKIEEAHLVG